jgi:DNA polymerase
MREKKKKERSAGFIVVQKSGGEFKVLGLRVWGKIDIPKGHLESTESDLEAAIRECYEEAGITVDPARDMPWGTSSFTSERPHKDVVIFIAVTDQDPEIRVNPETKQYEHDGFRWLSWDEMKASCYPYLVGSINWAKSVIEKEKR